MHEAMIIEVLSLIVLFAGLCLLIGKPDYEPGWEDRAKEVSK